MPYNSIWNPYDILDIDKSRTICYGWAPSQGRKCHNPVAMANRQEAERMLSKMSRLDPSTTNLNSWLQELAHRILCKRNHQDQATSVVRKWTENIEEYFCQAEEEEEVQEDEDEIEAEIARLRELQERRRRAARTQTPVRIPRSRIDATAAQRIVMSTTTSSAAPPRGTMYAFQQQSSFEGHQTATSSTSREPSASVSWTSSGLRFESIIDRNFSVAEQQDGNQGAEASPRRFPTIQTNPVSQVQLAVTNSAQVPSSTPSLGRVSRATRSVATESIPPSTTTSSRSTTAQTSTPRRNDVSSSPFVSPALGERTPMREIFTFGAHRNLPVDTASSRETEPQVEQIPPASVQTINSTTIGNRSPEQYSASREFFTFGGSASPPATTIAPPQEESQVEPASPLSTVSDSSSISEQSSPTTSISVPTTSVVEQTPTDTSNRAAERSLSGDCSICYELLLDGSSLVCCRTQCKQYFHGSCMGQWLQHQDAGRKRCPYCRADWVE